MDLTLDDLDSDSIGVILKKCGERKAVLLSSTSKRYRGLVKEVYPDLPWRGLCYSDYLLTEKQGHNGTEEPTYEVAYADWEQAFKSYDPILVKKVIRFWIGMKKWLQDNFPESLHTLRPGVSEWDLDNCERTCDLKLPKAFRILYRLVDGQHSENHEGFPCTGLIGGYEYGYRGTYVYLYSLHDVVIHRNESETFGNSVMIAGSMDWLSKYFLMSCETGQVYVLCKPKESAAIFWDNVSKIPCMPISSMDGILLWLEELLRRLQAGILRIRTSKFITFDERKYICQMPEMEPFYKSMKIEGIKVSVSFTVVPEESDYDNKDFKFITASEVTMESIKFRWCDICKYVPVRNRNRSFSSKLGDSVKLHKLGDSCWFRPSALMDPCNLKESLNVRIISPEENSFDVQRMAYLVKEKYCHVHRMAYLVKEKPRNDESHDLRLCIKACLARLF